MSDRKDRFIVNAEDLIITPPGEDPPPVVELPPPDPDERAGCDRD